MNLTQDQLVRLMEINNLLRLNPCKKTIEMTEEKLMELAKQLIARGRAFAKDLIDNPPKKPLGLDRWSIIKTRQNHQIFLKSFKNWMETEFGNQSDTIDLILTVFFLSGINDHVELEEVMENRKNGANFVFFLGMAQQIMCQLFILIEESDYQTLGEITATFAHNKKRCLKAFGGAKNVATAVRNLSAEGAVVFEMPLYFDLIYAGDLLAVMPNGEVLYIQVESAGQRLHSAITFISQPVPKNDDGFPKDKATKTWNGAQVFEQETSIRSIPTRIRVKYGKDGEQELANAVSQLNEQHLLSAL